MIADDFSSAAASFVLYSGIVVAALKLLDWLLREHQKDWLRDKGESLWLWLSDIKSHLLVSWIGGDSFAYWSCLLIHFALAAFYFFGGLYVVTVGLGEEINLNSEMYSGLASAMAFAAYFIAAAYLLQRPWRAVLRFFASNGNYWLMVIKIFAVIYVVVYVANYVFFDGLLGNFGEYVFEIMMDGEPNWFLTTLVSVIASALIFSWFSLFMVLYIVFAGALIFFYLFLLLWLLRFCLLRIVEHKKGPVMGLAGLLIAAGAVFKTIIG